VARQNGNSGAARMSGIGGIVSGINYSLLFSSDSSNAADASAAILNDLYSNNTNNAPPTTFVSTGNPLTDLKLAQSQQTQDIAQEAKVPQVSEAITQFTQAVANSKTISDALANPYVQQVLLTANGLSSYIGQTALVQKAFLSDPSDKNSLVNQLGDSSLLSAVQTYNFNTNGLAELTNPKILSTLTNAYAEVEWRQSLDQATPGLSNALTFLSQASSIKSASDVVGNQTNFDVITTALGIPQQIVNQDVSAVNAAINAKLDYSKLQDPNYVTSLTDQYLLTQQQQTLSSASDSDSDSLTALAIKASSLIV
jgi:hypothetical protein